MSINTSTKSKNNVSISGNRRRKGLIFAGGLVLLLTLCIVHIIQGDASINLETIWNSIFNPDGDSLEQNIVLNLRIPRVLIGILTGIGLAVAGALLQTATKNPLASPTTLGINSGAFLAFTAYIIVVPIIPESLNILSQLSAVLISFMGGLAAAMLVYVIASTAQATPIRIALAGIAVAMVFSSMTSALLLFFREQTQGVLFWGSGSLVQSDWTNVNFVIPLVMIGILTAFLLGKRLDILLVGDDTAKSVGLNVKRTRFSAIFIGVFLAAVSVSVVGPIGFVGLIAPHLVRLMGITTQRLLILGSAIWGAVLLVGADIVGRLLSGNLNELPAGTITAIIGAPFLIWLARRVSESSSAGDGSRSSKDTTLRTVLSGQSRFLKIVIAFIVLLICASLAGIILGSTHYSLEEFIQSITGIGNNELVNRIFFDIRLPRILVAVVAGASLAISGVILQGVARNSLASPDLVGVLSGASLAVVFFMIIIPNPPLGSIQATAIMGAFAAFAIVYLSSWKGGLSPIKLALIGVSVTALATSLIDVILSKTNVPISSALVWIVGSTHAKDWTDFYTLMGAGILIIPIAWLIIRRLDIIALGDDISKSLGLSLEQSRLFLLIIAVSSAAVAVSIVGAIAFVGLVAPHMARIMIGSYHRKLLILSAVLGAILVVCADIIGRVVMPPSEIPSGIITALIGTPYFLWLLYRSKE
jgi:ferric hydroxamate transport system permease protein